MAKYLSTLILQNLKLIKSKLKLRILTVSIIMNVWVFHTVVSLFFEAMKSGVFLLII